MIDIEWKEIFPTPVMRSNLGRAFTAREREYFKKLQADRCRNVFNTRCANTQVLNAPEMAGLQKFVTEHIKQFAWKVISADPRYEFYITQSWVNFTHTGQAHHRHTHTNSLISGVLYIQVKKEVDSISVYRSITPQISVTSDQPNPYNAPSWRFAVDVGDLIIFPSNLSHGVEETTGEHTRISLAFNVFVKGDIGNAERLNSLEI